MSTGRRAEPLPAIGIDDAEDGGGGGGEGNRAAKVAVPAADVPITGRKGPYSLLTSRSDLHIATNGINC